MLLIHRVVGLQWYQVLLLIWLRLFLILLPSALGASTGTLVGVALGRVLLGLRL
jgi:hypothetical protein